MSLQPTSYRLLNYRPQPVRPSVTPVVGGSVASGRSVEPQGGTMQQSLEQVLDAIRAEANWFMTRVGQPASSTPKSNGNAPLFTLPDLGQLVDNLTKPAPKPAPKPDPKPAPKPDPKPAPKPQPGGTYTVKGGDSLSKIAQKTLGDGNRWREIYNLNRDVIANPNVIHPGMVLKLPGGDNKPAPAPAPGPAPSGNLFDRRESYYISQYLSKYNTREDVPGYDNGNCGPTSLTMVAKAFGKINPNPAQEDAAIEESRRRIGDSQDQHVGVSVAGLQRGAKSYGLSAYTRWDANSGTIAQELAKGRLVIVHGTVIKDDGRVYGGHYYVVTRVANGKAYLNDPAYPSGPRVISAALLDKSINCRGTHAMVSIGP